MDLCIYLYHTLPHLQCWKQASHPCMASPPDHCCLHAWRKRNSITGTYTTRRIKVCPSHQHCLSCPNTGILRAWKWDEVSSRIRKVNTVSWKRGKLTCLHFKAPFTQHVVPRKLPENCQSVFCANANMSRDWFRDQSRDVDLITLLGSVPERAMCEQKAGPMP